MLAFRRIQAQFFFDLLLHGFGNISIFYIGFSFIPGQPPTLLRAKPFGRIKLAAQQLTHVFPAGGFLPNLGERPHPPDEKHEKQ